MKRSTGYLAMAFALVLLLPPVFLRAGEASNLQPAAMSSLKRMCDTITTARSLSVLKRNDLDALVGLRIVFRGTGDEHDFVAGESKFVDDLLRMGIP